METEQAPRSAPPVYSDEIDLVELFQTLWQQKLLIVAVTVMFTAVAAGFSYLITPEYETKANVLPPKQSDIVGYSLGHKEAGLSQFTISAVYSIFKTNLLSESLRRTFFRDTYLPALASNKRSEAKDELWEEFDEILTVKAPDIKNRPTLYEVVVRYESPELATEWANLYIDMAAKKTDQDIRKDLSSEVAAKIQVIEHQIDVLRTTAQTRREDRIVRLRDALMVSESVGLDTPQVVAGKTSSDGDLAQFIDSNLMYMRGAKAIRAELGVLEKRENDDPFIGELRDLEKQLDFLKKIDVNPDGVSVFTLDGGAEVPETPVKPKKAIILVFGVILGGILGVFGALVRSMLNKRKLQVG